MKNIKRWEQFAAGESEYTLASLLLNTTGAISKMTGVPIGSAERDLKALTNWVVLHIIGDDEMKFNYKKLSKDVGSEKNASYYAERMLKAKFSGNDDLATRIYNEMIAAGVSNEKIDNKLDNIRESVVSVSEMSDRFDDVESKIQNVSEDIDGLKSKIKDISEKLNIIDVQDNERMKEHKDNYSEIKNSVDEIAKSVSEVKQAFNSISKLNDSVFDLKNTQLNTKNTISELESSFVKLKKKCVLGVTVLSILSAIVIVLEVVLMLS